MVEINQIVYMTAVIDYDYDACDQLTCFDGVGFEFDLNGNLAKKRDDMAGDMVYKFNYANRLREVLFADGTKAQYVYKSDGMRISQTDRTGKTTKYYWDNSNIPEALNEGDEDGNITLNLFPGTGFKSTKNGNQNSTQWRWFITDHLGSVIALTDNNRIITDEYTYDEYGTITQTKGSSYNPYKYIGQQYDEETGLIYLRARYYDSQTGRFVSRDPIGIRGGMNEYGYAGENPIKNNDIEGLFFKPVKAGIKTAIKLVACVSNPGRTPIFTHTRDCWLDWSGTHIELTCFIVPLYQFTAYGKAQIWEYKPLPEVNLTSIPTYIIGAPGPQTRAVFYFNGFNVSKKIPGYVGIFYYSVIAAGIINPAVGAYKSEDLCFDP